MKVAGNEPIMVCVQMCVYNHGRYLRKAIEGVLMQKTNFRYELLIAEDCSTDNSREIVLEYRKRYPNIIRALLNPVNIGAEENGRQIYESSRGKYVAICEGDDYWTDPYKLQTQVDFLENHPEYSGCYHSVKIVDENDNPCDIGQTPYIYHVDSDYGIEEWKKCILPGQSCSIVMKNIYSTMPRDGYNVMINARCNGDNKIPIVLLRYGKIRKMSREMSCYRRSYIGDSWNAWARKRDMRAYFYKNALEREKLATYFLGLDFIPSVDARGLLESVLDDTFECKVEARKLLQEMVVYNPYQFISFVILIDIKRIKEWKRPLLINLHFVNEDANYIIFGTGFYGEKCYEILDYLHVKEKVKSFWDNDKNKQGQAFHDVMIEKPNYIDEPGTYIILSSQKYEMEMMLQLKQLGCSSSKIISSSDFNKRLVKEYEYTLRKKYPLICDWKLMDNIGSMRGSVKKDDWKAS